MSTKGTGLDKCWINSSLYCYKASSVSEEHLLRLFIYTSGISISVLPAEVKHPPFSGVFGTKSFENLMCSENKKTFLHSSFPVYETFHSPARKLLIWKHNQIISIALTARKVCRTFHSQKCRGRQRHASNGKEIRNLEHIPRSKPIISQQRS